MNLFHISHRHRRPAWKRHYKKSKRVRASYNSNGSIKIPSPVWDRAIRYQLTSDRSRRWQKRNKKGHFTRSH
jgi:hypothetical protein